MSTQFPSLVTTAVLPVASNATRLQYTIWIFNPDATPQAWLRDTTFIAHDYMINDWC